MAERVTFAEGAPAARFILRGAATADFGCRLPTEPCRAETVGGRAALWLGPDEWLLLAPEADGAAVHAALAASLAGVPHALVDVSHRQSALLLEGPGAEVTLAGAVPLDLSVEAFPIGMCTRTVCEKAEIVLWRTGAERFHIEAWRSFMPYVRDLLAAIAAGDDAAP